MSEQLLIGAVAYTPNVVPIWEGIREYFAESPAPMDFVLFSNYGRQVEALRAGQVDIAWNTNLAYVRTVLQTGGRLALGSADSAQAAILPLYYLARTGADVDRLEVTRFDSDIGKHGDTGRSELDAIDAVLAGEADIAAIGITTWEGIGGGELMPEALEAVWQTEPYCHCMFTALDTLPAERYEPWVNTLLAMDWERPEHRRILELEGLHRWVRPELDGYAGLFAAVE
ncbi:PhnD/SsuA/transferrin family substrate-binding protein [Arthrobacter sp. UYEF20]|uniref:phosphate/phosphite/phosphonate ABC transporter substrate-binding protein n=1 Tax=Arthrobacter sp. UYEF20 TaxID=1756363 RepID=UPI00339A7B7C